MASATPIRYARTVDGESVAYVTLGAGPAMVLPPVGPWGLLEVEQQIAPWWGWYEDLAKHFTVVRYDDRGTGYSGKEPDFTLTARVRDLEAVADALELDSLVLFASQTAGPAAIAYAAKHPGRVDKLVLWCTTDRGADATGSPRAQTFLELMARDPAFARQVITHERLGWAQADLANQVADLLHKFLTPQIAQQYMAEAGKDDLSSELETITAPTLVLHRKELSYPAIDTARRMAAHIPNARLVELDGASIAPFIDDNVAKPSLEAFLGIDAHRPASPKLTERQNSPLSNRETDVLRLLADGRSNQEIAEALIIGVGTVKTHVNAILGKLGATNRTQAVSIARQRGIAN